MSKRQDAIERFVGQLLLADVPRPDREYVFMPLVDGDKPLRKYRFDLAWPKLMIACEIEGNLFTGGRHGGSPSARRDVDKYNFATLLGWRLIRIPQPPRKVDVLLVQCATGVRDVGEMF